MHYLIEQFGPVYGWLFSAIFVFLRYASTAGLAFIIFYILWKQSFTHIKIQTKFPNTQRIWHEIQHSALTAMVFALLGIGIYFMRLAGWTEIYLDVNEYGWGYFAFSVVFLIVLHDTYFYWMHRLMHHPKLFPILHKVHHVSNNPTPWASLSFHPLEALLEIGIVPLAILFMPFHPVALLIFATWSLTWNVLGHLGYELFPRGFVHHPFFRWFNTSTHHNMHHARSNCNYGLYFNFWDTVVGTNDPNYRAEFDRIKGVKKVEGLKG